VHAQPSADPWLPPSTCNGSAPGYPGGLSNCGYDGAGAALQHMYSGGLAPPAALNASGGDPALARFNQTRYFGDVWPGLSSYGFAYIPPLCAAVAPATPCRLHLAFHGCGQSVHTPAINTSYVVHGGYLPWAAANNIVVLFPQSGGYLERNATAPSAQLQAGCWDGYGQTGWDYAFRSGPQSVAARAMIAAVAGF
jgi:hypothetical protein